MSETLIPTMNLRFVERDELGKLSINAGTGESYHVGKKVRVLQQMFREPRGGGYEYIWRDVPLEAV